MGALPAIPRNTRSIANASAIAPTRSSKGSTCWQRAFVQRGILERPGAGAAAQRPHVVSTLLRCAMPTLNGVRWAGTPLYNVGLVGSVSRSRRRSDQCTTRPGTRLTWSAQSWETHLVRSTFNLSQRLLLICVN